MSFRLLLIDDEVDSIAPLRDEAIKVYPNITHVDFAGAQAAIEELEPHLVVLDLMLGSGPDQRPEGLQTFEYVWAKRFCPLVVYTGFPEALKDEPRSQHPFVRVVQKGSGSEMTVLERIKEFGSHISALDDVQKEIRVAMNRALKEVAPIVFGPGIDPKDIGEVLVRAARRRVAVAMDEALSTNDDKTLMQWEHYLAPPIGVSLLTGDVLMRSKADPTQPESYVVVLTPSCDLAQEKARKAGEKDRKPKVDSVLVAQCENSASLMKEIPLKVKDEVKAEILKAVLNQGHGKAFLPLAAFPGIFPAMVANFRRLALLGFDQIDITQQRQPGGAEFVRVASVDSPFRELVAWAYMICAARPALPDRDVDSWAKEMLPTSKEAAKK